METPIKMDDLGVPLFLGNIHITYNPIWDPESLPQKTPVKPGIRVGIYGCP